MNAVAEAYDRGWQREWNRLVKDPYHSLEFLVTWHYLRKYLPSAGRVLDAGGGPGRYALELCRAGYQVVLLDISPKLISVARERFELEPDPVRSRLLDAIVGDVQDLSCLEADSFDAVLCLGGPLTHISQDAGRWRAWSELVRVARPGAIVFASVVGYLAVLRTILVRFSDELLTPSFQTLVESGDAAGTTGTVWHFYRAEELRGQAEQCGLTTLEMAGCQGLSTGLAEATNQVGQDEAKWERWVELVVRTSAEPAVADMAEHILYIGQVNKTGRGRGGTGLEC